MTMKSKEIEILARALVGTGYCKTARVVMNYAVGKRISCNFGVAGYNEYLTPWEAAKIIKRLSAAV